MKRILACILAVTMLISLAACGGSGGGATTAAATTAAATTTAAAAATEAATTAAAETTAAATEAATTTAAATTKAAETTTAATEAATTEAPKEIVEFSMTIFDRGVPAEAGTPEDNATIRFINENLEPLGARLVVKSAPRYEARNIWNTWIAAGTAPDLLYEYSQPWLSQLKLQGTLIPLDGYIEKYSTNYKAYVATIKDMIAPFVEFDGESYALTSLRAYNSLFVAGIWYRKDILDKTGFTGPIDTIEQLTEALRAVKQTDDTMFPIGYSPHYHNLIRSIYGLSAQDLLDPDGNLIPDWQSENYKFVLDTLRTYYMEGLVDPEYITDENYARRNVLLTTGKIAFNMDSVGPPSGYEELYANDPGVDWQALGTVSSQYGNFLPTPQLIPYLYLMFTKGMSEEKIEAAFKFVDWLLAEKDNPSPEPFGNKYNWQDVSRGLEGVQWNFDANGMRQNVENPDPIWVLGGETAVIQNPPMLRAGEMAAAGANEYQRSMLAKQESMMQKLGSLNVAGLYPVGFSSDDMTELNTSWSPIKTDIETMYITDPNYSWDQAKADFDSNWSSLNGPKIWAEANSWYQANKPALTDSMNAWVSWMNGLSAELGKK